MNIRFFFIALFIPLTSCGQIPPPRPVPAKAPDPIVIQAAPLPARILVEHTDNCAAFKPVYLTSAEVKLLSPETLLNIVTNNNEGQQHCGWKQHTPPQEKPHDKSASTGVK
jgi:hypothetical protein